MYSVTAGPQRQQSGKAANEEAGELQPRHDRCCAREGKPKPYGRDQNPSLRRNPREDRLPRGMTNHPGSQVRIFGAVYEVMR